MSVSSPRLIFGGSGAAPSSRALCSLPDEGISFYGSGSTVVVVDAKEPPLRVESVLPTRPLARVAAVSAAVSSRRSCVLVAAALSDGGLATFQRNADGAWTVGSIVEATSRGGKEGARLNAVPLVAVAACFSEDDDTFWVASAAMDNSHGSGLCILWQLVEETDPAAGSAGLPENATVESGCMWSLASFAVSPTASVLFLPECIALTSVSGTVLVAVAGTDKILRLYEGQRDCLRAICAPLGGHRDWVRGLSFSMYNAEDSSFFLASASTDCTARIWEFTPASSDRDSASKESMSFEAELETEIGSFVRTEANFGSSKWIISLQALLSEHQAAVLSVCFSSSATFPAALTASMDGSVGVWRQKCGTISASFDASIGDYEKSWNMIARFGLLGGTGAAALGFSSAVFTSSGVGAVFAHTLGGSLHSWRSALWRPNSREGDAKQEEDCRYFAESCPSGHTNCVTSVEWDPMGRYLTSSGEDKTTRIFVPYKNAKDGISCDERFVEWARPQVHGHPVREVRFLAHDGRSFASVADEKVLRLFDAPEQFQLPALNDDGSLKLSDSSGGIDGKAGLSATTAGIVSATIPELGLSNKPVYHEGDAAGDVTEVEDDVQSIDGDEGGPQVPMDSGMSVVPISSFGAERKTTSAPLEIELRQGRLWPERMKLYGHGNDVSCVAVNRDLGILASASKAQSCRDAFIILWDIATGLEKARLVGHELTVNQLRFSPDGGTSLLAVSRDRSFAVFGREDGPLVQDQTTGDDRFQFDLLYRHEKAHARLLYSGCWVGDSNALATGARDKHLKLWTRKPRSSRSKACVRFEQVFQKKFSSGVSALDSIYVSTSDKRFSAICIGLGDGTVLFARVYLETEAIANSTCLSILTALPRSSYCCGRVTNVAWRPSREHGVSRDPSDERERQIAIGCEDNAVRIFAVDLGVA